MKMDAGQIRKGWIIEYNGKRCSVLSATTVKPGKGGAYAQVEMRDIKTGLKDNHRFRTSESVEKLTSSEKNCQFLFADNDGINFMENETYEQFALSRELIGEAEKLLSEGMEVIVSFVEGDPVGITLPKTVICEVVETESVIKGQTAASSNKPAMLDCGIRVMVPPFVKLGEKIVLNTEELTYVERAK